MRSPCGSACALRSFDLKNQKKKTLFETITYCFDDYFVMILSFSFYSMSAKCLMFAGLAKKGFQVTRE